MAMGGAWRCQADRLSGDFNGASIRLKKSESNLQSSISRAIFASSAWTLPPDVE
jgi:hypothetical protein